jgi:hypothetical protein
MKIRFVTESATTLLQFGAAGTFSNIVLQTPPRLAGVMAFCSPVG